MRCAVPIIVLLAVLASASHAAPSRDDVVARNLLPRSAKQAVALMGTRGDESQAARLARVRTLLQAGRASGDTRTLGLAEATLAGVAEDDEVRVLRATLEQSRHRFAAARTLLDRVLATQPRHPQALLTRATIGAVTGDYAIAVADCRTLREVNVDAAAICGAQVDALTGGQQHAAQVLAIAERRTEGALLAWTQALQGQLAEQRGDARAAVAAYRASLRHADDLSTRIALADVLLAERAFDDLASVLRDAPPADGVLLRRWLAERAQGRSADALDAQLTQRFAEAEQRGELLHAREAALFALARGDARQALRWAQQNWQAQREPADLVALARAARAAGDHAAERGVAEWLQRTGLSDVRVERALGRSTGGVG
jgi:tetratricopeptide (TPR) repeat protein